MKTYITESYWSMLEHALMQCNIPYTVSFDTVVSDDMSKLIHDKHITITPFSIRYEEELEN